MMILQDPLDLRYAEYNWGSQPDLGPHESYSTLSSSFKTPSSKYDQPDGGQPSYSGVNLKRLSSEGDEDHIF